MLQLPTTSNVNARRNQAPDFAAIVSELEPLVVRYFKARQPWARAVMLTSRPPEWTEETQATYTAALDARGARVAEDAMADLFERIEAIAAIVDDEPITGLDAMRAHMLIALWRASPAFADTRELRFNEETAFEILFHACVPFCGLTPLVRSVERGLSRTPTRKGSAPTACPAKPK